MSRVLPTFGRLWIPVMFVGVAGLGGARPVLADLGPSWRPSASFELGVDSFSQVFRITDDLTGSLLDTESSFRDTTDVFTEFRAAAEFTLDHESEGLSSSVAARLSTGTELDREGLEWEMRLRPSERDRIDVDLDIAARQFRDDADFSLDSDNQEGRLRVQWRREGERWRYGLKTRANVLRFDTRSIYELDADRLDTSVLLGWRDGWKRWVDVELGGGVKDVRDSTAISYEHFFASADVGLALGDRWQWQLRPVLERRVYEDASIRRPFWDLSLDSQLEWKVDEHWRLRGKSPLEWLRPDQNTSVYFDLFNGRIGIDLARSQGAFEVGIEPRWSWLSSSLEVEDSYRQPSVWLHLDWFGSERFWVTLGEEIGDRRYTHDTADGLDLYSDYTFFRTSLLGGLRLSEHVAFEFFLSDEPESHRRGSDDSRLTLISASLRASL